MEEEKYLKTLNKEELIKSNLREREIVKQQIEKNNKLSEQIYDKNVALNKLKNIFDKKLGVPKDQLMYVEYVTGKGIVRSAQGYIVSETTKNIMINVFDEKEGYFYISSKDNIKETRRILTKKIINAKIWYGQIKKGWKPKTNKNEL